MDVNEEKWALATILFSFNFLAFFFLICLSRAAACQPHPNLHASVRDVQVVPWDSQPSSDACQRSLSIIRSSFLSSKCLTRKSVPLNEEKTIHNLPLVRLIGLMTLTRYFALVVREGFSPNQTSNVSIRFDIKFSFEKFIKPIQWHFTFFVLDLTKISHEKIICNSSFQSFHLHLKMFFIKLNSDDENHLPKFKTNDNILFSDWRWEKKSIFTYVSKDCFIEKIPKHFFSSFFTEKFRNYNCQWRKTPFFQLLFSCLQKQSSFQLVTLTKVHIGNTACSLFTLFDLLTTDF